jgi:hypothetical protein
MASWAAVLKPTFLLLPDESLRHIDGLAAPGIVSPHPLRAAGTRPHLAGWFHCSRQRMT